MVPVVAYIRYSSDNQKESSLDDQEREIRAYAKRKGFEIVKVYADKALSAKTDDRPAFLQMIKDAESGTFERVVCWKVNRFSRNRLHSLMYKKKLAEHGVSVEYVAESIPDGPEGIILESVLEGMAEFYSAELAQNIKRGMEGNALRAKYNGGVIPFGLKLDRDRKLVPCEETAPIVEKVFTDFDRGKSLKDIAAELNAAKVTNSIGNSFKPNAVSALLRRVQYVGTYSHSGVVVEGAIEPIVDKELFDRVQKRLDTKKNKRTVPVHDFVLTGKLFCGHCKSMMVGTSGTSRTGEVHSYYICQKKKKKACTKRNVRQYLIEDLLIEKAHSLLTDCTIKTAAEDIATYCKEQENNPYTQQLYKEQADIQKALDNLATALERGEEVDFILSRVKTKRTELQDVEERIARERDSRVYFSEDDVVCFLNYLKTGDVTNEVYRSSLISIFINRVYLYDDEDSANDKMIVVLNAGDKPVLITANLQGEIEGAFSSSDRACSAPPITAGQRLIASDFSFCKSGFGGNVEGIENEGENWAYSHTLQQ